MTKCQLEKGGPFSHRNAVNGLYQLYCEFFECFSKYRKKGEKKLKWIIKTCYLD
jgi:hypothetical protein